MIFRDRVLNNGYELKYIIKFKSEFCGEQCKKVISENSKRNVAFCFKGRQVYNHGPNPHN
jgi:hypothetical protein